MMLKEVVALQNKMTSVSIDKDTAQDIITRLTQMSRDIVIDTRLWEINFRVVQTLLALNDEVKESISNFEVNDT